MTEATQFRRIAACLLMVVLAAPARATTYGEVEVIVEVQPRDQSWHGYFEYVLVVTNRSAERTHVVTLKMPHDRRYAGLDTIRDLRRTVQVGPKETVRVALLQPDYPW